MRLKKHQRNKVQKAYLERRLYKTDMRIEKLQAESLVLRETIKVMETQAAKKRADREAAMNKALHDVAIKSIPTTKGGTDNASNIREGKETT